MQVFLFYVMKLFRYEGYKVIVEPEALMLAPFKALDRRDKSRSKDRLNMELAYIYFFCDSRSDYQFLTDDQQRSEAIIEGEGFPADWKPNDKLLQEAIVFYNKFKTTAELLLEDTRFAVDKLRTLLRTIDLTKEDDKGKPVYTLNTITATIKLVPGLVKDLDDAEKAIAAELRNAGKMRGQGEKTIFEDSMEG